MKYTGRFETPIAIVALTPLQVFHALVFVQYYELSGVDLYVFNWWSGTSRLICENIERAGIFNKVVWLEHDHNNPFVQQHIRLADFCAACFPKLYCKKIYGLSLRWPKYKSIFITAGGRQRHALIYASGCRNLIAYDDGFLSYTIVSLADLFSLKCKLGNWLHRVSLPSMIFLSNPKYYMLASQADAMRNIYDLGRIPLLAPRQQQAICAIFGYEKAPPVYSTSSFIYFSQTLHRITTDRRDHFEDVVQPILNEMGDVVIRLHPGSKKNGYEGYRVLQDPNFWELICWDSPMEEACLVGVTSTTLFTPKFYYDKEPYVIFTCMMLKDFLSEQYLEAFNGAYHMLKSAYRDRTKVMRPESLEEFRRDVREVEERRGKRT